MGDDIFIMLLLISIPSFVFALLALIEEIMREI
jgi:hypothetical protein